MDDVPSGSVNLARGTGDTVTPSFKPNVSNPPSEKTTVANHRQCQPQSQPGPEGFIAHGRKYGPLSPLDMSQMAHSLPAHSTQPQFDPNRAHHPYPPPSAHTPGFVYPMPPMGHFTGQTGGAGVGYGMPYGPAYVTYPMPQHTGPAQHGHYPPFGTGHSPVYGATYYPPPYSASWNTGSYPMVNQPRPPVSARPSPQPSASSTPGPPRKEVNKRPADAEYDVSKTIVDGSNPPRLAQTSLGTDPPPAARSPSNSNVPRGPPRKPKQSGHALWVGNLPPGASVLALKDHFSRDATHEIESVFLISKSNCAFVNYNSAASCAAALVRFHDSRFQGVRLVCRLRKGVSVPGSGTRGVSEVLVLPAGDDALPVATEPGLAPPYDGPRRDRYFVVKSLTVEDLELSKQSGIWATQTHNEINLNHAFENTEHVYLIFSANKSGEYFGYARMLSPISDDEELAQEMPPRPEPLTGEPDELDVTTTAATSTAPKGRIIDDPARGTTFWEVESLQDDHEEARSERSADGVDEEVEPESQSFGKPFRIQWLSTERVLFHRTRGLRNPWNANREVKIARDGTEIEPTVGRKLIQLFHTGYRD